MIAYLEGIVHAADETGVVVLIGGIGYRVSVPERQLTSMTPGSSVRLHVHQHIREDALELYGFPERAELAFFKKLISVSGVGPRLGLAVLSAYAVEQVQRAIIHGDTAFLTSISGVGKKTAERIIIDLKDSVGVLAATQVQSGGAPARAQLSAVEALLSLGYTAAEAQQAVQGVDSTLPLEEQVRVALKRFSE